MVIELEIVKTRISAPAHSSATGIGRVSGLVALAFDLLPRNASRRVLKSMDLVPHKAIKQCN